MLSPCLYWRTHDAGSGDQYLKAKTVRISLHPQATKEQQPGRSRAADAVIKRCLFTKIHLHLHVDAFCATTAAAGFQRMTTTLV